MCGVQEFKKENIESMCSHYKSCQADPGLCLSYVYPSPNLTFSHNTKTEQHSCKEDS